MQESPLFDEFDAVSAKAWKQKIQYGLKGADYNEALVWESPEGIKVKPFYHQDTLRETLANRDAPSTAWKIGGVHVVGDVGKSNQKALQLIQGGAESLVFILPAAGMDLRALLSGIDLRSVPLHFDFRFLSDEALGALLGTVGKRKGDLHLHIDPIAHLARSGNWYASMDSDLAVLDKIPPSGPGISREACFPWIWAFTKMPGPLWCSSWPMAWPMPMNTFAVPPKIPFPVFCSRWPLAAIISLRSPS